MAKIRRILRKVDPPHDAALDEQLWPVNVALVLLGAFSLGATLAYLRFNDPRWWANAWTYVVLTPLVVGGAMLAFRVVSNKLFRRSMQLAVVASAIAHIALVIISAESVIFTTLLVESKQKPSLNDQPPPRTSVQLNPDLLQPETDEPRDFEKPVETETPEIDPDPVLKQEPTPEESSPRKPQPVPIPEPQKTAQPAVVKRPTTEQAAPREAPALSQLSRNTQARDLAPAGAKVQVERTAQASRPTVAPTVVAVERTATQHQPAARTTPDAPTATQPRESVAVARKTSDTAPTADTTATATLRRQVNQPALTPKSQIDMADAPSVAQRTNPTQPTPNNTAAVRRSTASPEIRRTLAEPTIDPASSSQAAANATRRELDSKPQPALATAPSSVATRQPRVTPRPAATAETVASAASGRQPSAGAELAAQAVETPRSAAAGSTAAARSPAEAATGGAPSVAPATTQARAASGADEPSVGEVSASSATRRAARGSAPNVVTQAANVEANSGLIASATREPVAATALASRQNAANDPAATQTQPSVNVPSDGAGTPLAVGGPTRARSTEAPSLNPSVAATNSPQRATRAAQIAASPAAIERPAVVGATAGAADPTATPARLALSRSQSGMAGAGNSPNLDRGTGSGESPALVASVAARRTQATSNGPADAAFTPSTPATRAHSRSSATSPSASFQADTLAEGSEGGAPRAGELTASASASLARSTGSEAAGEVSAAKGTAEVDVGASTIVAEAGLSRAAGDGQPELSFDPQMGPAARRSPSGAAEASITAERIAAIPEAPPAAGGGQPGSLDPSATLAVRGDASQGMAGGPSQAEDRGLLAERSAATLVAQTPASRADASQGGEPGTGDGSPEEDEEEKKRRLARATLAAGAPMNTGAAPLAEAPPASAETGTGVAAAGDAGPASTATGRLSGAAGAAAGNPSSAAEVAGGGGAGVGETALARAELATAADAPRPTPGGGTGTPARASGGPAIAAPLNADQVQLAGAPDSGGATEGLALQAQGIAAAKTSGGATSRVVEGAIGAAAGEEVVDAFGPMGAGDVAGGSRSVSPGLDEGPSLSALAVGGGPGRQAAQTTFAGEETGPIEVPLVGPASAVAQADLDHGMAAGVGRTATDAGEGLTVNIDAPEAAGGLGNLIAGDVGLTTRLARADSLEIGPQPTRFVGRRSGGIPAVSTLSVVPTESYKKRAEGRAGRGALPPQTEAVVEAGLEFLARYQQTDGSWRLQGLETSRRSEPQMVSDTAATALAVLAFQGAGYNHREHKYASVVRNGLDYLVRNQQENGDLFLPLDDQSNRSVWLYSHALATLALCEAYGMTQDPALQEPAQKAVDFIVAGQHKTLGGWRYAPGIDSDTSVTGTMLVALRSAELAELKVPQESYDGVVKWLEKAQASPSQSHLYRYRPHASDAQRHGRVASPTMTSLGLLMRLYLGWKRDHANMAQGADYLKENLPSLGTSTDPRRDTYYWYYATQVMYHMGGDHWKQWHEKLHQLLVETQVKQGPLAGSWDPRLPVADRWGTHGGRLYVTTLNLLSLEVQYRHLPTYEDTAK
jgi:hypothetical protein